MDRARILPIARRLRGILAAALTLLPLALGRSAWASPPEGGRTIVALVDDTASFAHLGGAVAFIRRITAGLEAGDELAVLRICADSFGDDNLVLLARMPQGQRAFDPGLRRRLLAARGTVDGRIRQLAQLPAARGQASGRALSGRCARTDILGALYSAARLLAGAGPDRERWLFVLSDMVDDVSRPASRPPSLEGAHVRLLFVQRGAGRGAVDEFEKRVGRWRQVATQSGASSVVVCDPLQTARVADPFAELTCGG